MTTRTLRLDPLCRAACWLEQALADPREPLAIELIPPFECLAHLQESIETLGYECTESHVEGPVFDVFVWCPDSEEELCVLRVTCHSELGVDR